MSMALDYAMETANGAHCGELQIVTADGIELASLDGLQGLWTEEQFLKLVAGTNRLVEFTDGWIEILPVPTRTHQAILGFVYRVLYPFILELGGELYLSGLGMRTRPGKFRQPDLLALLDAADPRNQNAYWHGADWVLEVVSPGDPNRDLVQKRSDYAEAGIPEYWIVNPLNDTITVLTLADGQYVEHGLFRPGDRADSPTLPGFTVDVAAVFAADEPAKREGS